MTQEDRAQAFKALLDHLERSGLHLRESGRQFLLALEEISQVVALALEIAGRDQPLLRTLIMGIIVVRGVLGRAASQIPPYAEELEILHLRLDTLGILRDYLRGELLRLSPDDPLRKEGLLIALGYVDQEIERWGEKLHEVQSQRGEKAPYTTIPVEEPTQL